MAGVLEKTKKKPPPPRPLKRSSLSGKQALRKDGGVLQEATEPSASDRIRSKASGIDDVVEPQPNCATTELEEARDTLLGEGQSSQGTEGPIHADTVTGDVSSVDYHEPDIPGKFDSRSDISEDEKSLDNLSIADEGLGSSGSRPVGNEVGDETSINGRPAAGNDGEPSDKQSIISSDDDFREKLMNAVELILGVDSRLRSVEEKFRGDTSKGEQPAAGVEKTSERQPCIPQLKRLDWYNFKNKWIEEKEYAIEVLHGSAKHYRDREKERRRIEKLKKAGNNPTRSRSEVEHDILTPQDVPERIRINSVPIMAILVDLDPIPFRLTWNPGTMLRPYKRLIRLEDTLMNHLSGLEAKWAVAESEDCERKADCTPDIAKDEHITSTPSRMSGEENDNPLPTSALSSSPGANESSGSVSDVPKNQASTPSDPLTDSIEALRDLRCLKQFFELYIHPTVNRLRSKTALKVKFADLWYLFPHGEEVFLPSALGAEARSTFTRNAESGAYQSIYRVYDHSGGRPPLSSPDSDDEDSDDEFRASSATVRVNPFNMMCYHIDWDTKSHSPVSHEIEIKAFEGDRDITSLEVYPTRYHKDFEPIRQQLLTRGRKFLELTKPSHLKYYGRTYDSSPCGPDGGRPLSATSFVESEVMVDFEQSPRGWRPNFGLEECYIYEREGIDHWDLTFWQDKEHSQSSSFLTEAMFFDQEDEKWLRERAREQDSFLCDWYSYQANHRKEPIRVLGSDRDLILLPSRVMGYSYRDRTFNAFNIDYLEPVTPKSEGFDGLALPKGHQLMVEALVKEHFIKKEAYEKHGRSAPGMDIVSGKGRGLIILLHGFPGVGKTSTAECVAQSTGRPLFPITCGDLGLDPVQVESSLNSKFRLAAKWNCVMLLDEADIFLAKRDKISMERNALVSVFLRVLEYYEGILFLTTNRVGTFDDAFKSRIHVSLYYPPLTKVQTLKIWEKNLNRLKRIEEARAEMTGNRRLIIQDRDILAYAEQHYKEHRQSTIGLWNGRQIRNAFQTAAALAYHNAGEDVPFLSPQLFKDVANTTDAFDQYIYSVHGEKDEAQRAYDHFERVDHLTKETGKRSRDAHTTPTPMTPVPNPRDRFFSNSGRQDVQIKLEDSGYAGREGLVDIPPEHAVLTSSASSSRVLTDTTRISESLYTSPGAAMHAYSPSVAAKASRAPMRDDSQRYDDISDSEEDEDE